MQAIKYAEVAWNDIQHSEGWLKKVFLLALLQFVPVFGQLVLFGYLYGWARDIAWGVHAPLPAKIFGNEDGKLYSRGFFILVLLFVLLLVPGLLVSISSAPLAVVNRLADGPSVYGAVLGMAGLSSIVSFALTLFCFLFWGIGAMRIAIYDRISAGFQLKQVWAMLRYDTNGVLRIAGMAVLFGIVGSIIIGAVVAILSLIVFGSSLPGLIGLGNDPSVYQVFSILGPSLTVWILLILVVGFFSEAFGVFIYMMVARASGYWTQQFQVAQWRGQDDPMPFELVQMQQQQQYQQYPPAGTGV